MVIVDTSVFVDFFNGKKNNKTMQLATLLSSEENVAICGIIYQECLQGIANDNDFKNIKAILDELITLPCPDFIYLHSAILYRKLRKNGVTIRKSVDVTIATIAIKNDVCILENDHDFQFIAKHSALKIYGG